MMVHCHHCIKLNTKCTGTAAATEHSIHLSWESVLNLELTFKCCPLNCYYQMNVFINTTKIQKIPTERCWKMAVSQWSIKLDAKLQLNLKVWLCKDARVLWMFFISPLKWVNSPMVMNFCLKWNSSNFSIAAYKLHLPCTHWVNWGGSHLEKEVFRRLPVPVFLIAFTKTESIT